MQIRNVGSQETYHAPSGVARALISAGVAVEVLPTVAPKQTGSLDWTAVRGPAVADTEMPPAIFFSACSACRKEGGYMKGPTVHITGKVFHCGAFETVPAHVAELRTALQTVQATAREEETACRLTDAAS